ncbi:hypothetical protein WDU99_10990 [Microbacterium sp. Mu-80]|uniref:Phage holin family protein n=1 Tax=Microbacterium bandirmense TaxID=3122050 RepID=A0ABU8LCT8_9MICO
MINLLIRGVLFVVSAGLGLLVADLLLPDFRILWDQWWGFVICVLVFAVLQSVLSPWVVKIAHRYAPVLLGGVGIFSTLIALIVVVLLPIGGLRIDGVMAWLLGAVIVWLVTALGALLLPMLFLRRAVQNGGRAKE